MSEKLVLMPALLPEEKVILFLGHRSRERPILNSHLGLWKNHNSVHPEYSPLSPIKMAPKKKSKVYKPPKPEELPPFSSPEKEEYFRIQHYKDQKGCTLEQATIAYHKNAKCREDKKELPLSLIPNRTRSSRTPSSSNNLNNPNTPIAKMPPSGGRQDKKAKDAGRASTSRNTTPSGSIAGSTVNNTPTTLSPFSRSHLRTEAISKQSLQSLLDAPAGSSAPDSSTIRGMVEHSEEMVAEAHNDHKELQAGQQKLLDVERKQTAALAEGQEDVEIGGDSQQAGGSTASKSAEKRARRKKLKANAADRSLVPGAHAVAAQDGSNQGMLHQTIAVNHFTLSNWSLSDNGTLATAPIDPDTASSSLSPAQTTPVAAAAPHGDAMDLDDAEDAMSEVQPAHPNTEKLIFGDDPTKFDDPTVYEITKVHAGMSDAEIKMHAAVASFPRSDLCHLTAGSPPDRDFVQSKPTNQVQATTFATHTEGYLRPFTEEDEAWLRERGDRVGIYAMPKLGEKHYTQIWAEEDGVDAPEGSARKSAPEPHGSMDDMNDAIAETGELSAGPVMNRFMGLFRNENRTLDDSTSNVAEEDGGENDDLAAILEGSTAKSGGSRAPFPPATRLAEPPTEPGKKYIVLKQSAEEKQKRLIEELTYAGFLDENTVPNYAAPEDDEVSVKIRELQAQLKVVSAKNNARKSIIKERLTEQMAYQEYTHISDDLDNQVTSQYQKRTRTMGKKNKKRSGGAGGGANAAGGGMAGVAKPGLEGATKTAMDRRKKWKEQVGPVFDDPKLGKVPRAADESSSIFTPEAMARHMAKEAALMEEEDAEAEDE